MDDFYTEMRGYFEDPVTTQRKSSSSSDFLPTYFPNMFAEGLIPLNPRHWSAYWAGSAMSNEMPEFGDKIQTPFVNLQVAKEYLESSKSDIQWRDRF